MLNHYYKKFIKKILFFAFMFVFGFNVIFNANYVFASDDKGDYEVAKHVISSKDDKEKKGPNVVQFGGTEVLDPGDAEHSPRLRGIGGKKAGGGGSKKKNSTNSNEKSSNISSTTIQQSFGTPPHDSVVIETTAANILEINQNFLDDTSTEKINETQQIEETVMKTTEETQIETVIETVKESIEDTKEESVEQTVEETFDETYEETEKETNKFKSEEILEETTESIEVETEEDIELESDEINITDETEEIITNDFNNDSGNLGGKKIFEINNSGGIGISNSENGLNISFNFVLLFSILIPLVIFIIKMIIFKKSINDNNFEKDSFF